MEKQKKNRKLLIITLCVVIVCGIIGTVISAVQFKKNAGKTSASTSIEFSFEGAATGTAPNGYAYDLSGIRSAAVLDAALESAGMNGRYTAEDLQGHINVQGIYPDDIVDQMLSYDSTLDFSANRAVTATNYHPTKYSVILNNDFDKDISSDDLQKLLGCIMDEYKAYFARTYCTGANEIDVRYTLSDYDYPQQLSILTRLMEESSEYADEMYEKKPTLRIGGIGFADISLQLNNLIETDISKLSANVTMNALTKNPDRLIIQYRYEIRSLNNQLEKKTDQMARLDKMIGEFEKSEIIYLNTSEKLTKLGGTSSEIYDNLIIRRNTVSSEITNIKANISTYQLRLNDLIGNDEDTSKKEDVTATEDAEGEAETMSQEEIDALAQAAAEAKAAQTEKLEADIEKLVEKRAAVMTEFAELINLYNEQMINDMTVTVSNVRYNKPTFLSGAFIKSVLKTAGPICVVGFLVCIVIIIIAKKKEADQSLSD